MFKNNMPSEWSADFYRCLHEMHGSDHRPVQLGVTLKDFGHPNFQELHRLLDMNNPIQGYGEIKVQMVGLNQIDLTKIFSMKKLAVPEVTQSEQLQRFDVRVSFYDQSLDRITSPINFSEHARV